MNITNIVLYCVLLCLFICIYLNIYQIKEQFDRIVKPNDKIIDRSQFYQYNPNNPTDTGYPKCLKDCNGICVAYGITGSSWCYY